jgi:polysaccharide biosynthesis/export protein
MRRTFVVLGLLMSILQGCGGPHYEAAYFPTPANAPYKLGAGDRLRVIVFGQDTLSNAYDVDGSGNISMPLIGLVHAAGFSTTQLQEELVDKLRDGFLRDPQVSVEVEAYRPFFILGEVTTAGQYPFISGMSVETAVAVAGGYTPRAYKTRADLTRVINGVPVTASVPMTQLVQPGDTITVRERFF